MTRIGDPLLRHIELWLSALGLVLIFLIVLILSPDASSVWRTATVAAVTIGVLHGLIFWLVRSRQRAMREEAIDEIREMLSDVVKNQLAVIGLSLAEAPGSSVAQREAISRIQNTLTKIELLIDSISEDSLEHWKDTYAASDGALRALEEVA